MHTTKTTSIQIRQNGQILKAFKGCRFLCGENASGIVGKVLCFESAKIGDARDPRRGRIITQADFKGPVTIEVLNPAGEVISRFGLATAEQVAKHPNRATTKANR